MSLSGVPPLSARVCSIWTRDIACEEEEARATIFNRQRAPKGSEVRDPVGLVDSVEFANLDRAKKVMVDEGERAVLAQSLEHYAELRAKFPTTANTLSGESEPGFGEQLIVEGLTADRVCLGDVFEVEKKKIRLKVTMPRLACPRVDAKHPLGLATGKPGTMRQFVSATGRGWIFFRVLVPGHIGEGDQLTLVYRPLPDWTLFRVSSLCYPQTPLKITFAGTDAELNELCALPELGIFEWKERLLDVQSERRLVDEAPGATSSSPSSRL